MILATHNSATGEPSASWLSALLIPFARCQGLTIGQQAKAGVHLFDIRVRIIADKLRLAHGLWAARTTPSQALTTIGRHAAAQADMPISPRYYVMLTYEGRLTAEGETDFLRHFHSLREQHPSLRFIECNVKKPRWRNLWTDRAERPNIVQDYPRLVPPDPRTLLPIPYLWNRLRKPAKFKETDAVMRDFVR